MSPPAGERRRGHCLCGAVRFTARIDKDEADACHCGMCRRWSGGVAIHIQVKDLSFDDASSLGVHRSSDWGERLFCRACGTSLGWRMVGGDLSTIGAYAFDPPIDPPLAVEIFVDDKPSGYAFAGERTRLTGAQVTAMFAGTDET